MKNEILYQTSAEYTTDGGQPSMIKHGVAYTEDDKEVYYNDTSNTATLPEEPWIDRDEAVAGDVCFADEVGRKRFLHFADRANAPSGWTAIGCVVVPSTHSPYGRCHICAFKFPSVQTPEEGTTTQETVIYGGTGRLANTNFPPRDLNSLAYDGTLSNTTYKYLASDMYTHTDICLDPNAGYCANATTSNANMRLISVYDSDGVSRNPEINTSVSNQQLINTEMFGKDRTMQAAACCAAGSNISWTTASTITNSDATNNWPACEAALRYHTVGTKAWDWYIPAMGEVVYLVQRFKVINATLKEYGLDIMGGSNVRYIGSSTESRSSTTDASYSYVAVAGLLTVMYIVGTLKKSLSSANKVDLMFTLA